MVNNILYYNNYYSVADIHVYIIDVRDVLACMW